MCIHLHCYKMVLVVILTQLIHAQAKVLCHEAFPSCRHQTNYKILQMNPNLYHRKVTIFP